MEVEENVEVEMENINIREVLVVEGASFVRRQCIYTSRWGLLSSTQKF